jgi:hypothetical protein
VESSQIVNISEADDKVKISSVSPLCAEEFPKELTICQYQKIGHKGKDFSRPKYKCTLFFSPTKKKKKASLFLSGIKQNHFVVEICK